MQVKTLMRHPCGIVEVSASLAAAGLRLASNPGASLVVTERGRLTGVLGEADIRAANASSVRPIADYEWPPLTARLTVGHAMRPNPVVIGAGAPVVTVARVLRARGERVAVVMEGADIVGVVTAGDVLGALVDRLDGVGRMGLTRLLVAVSTHALAQTECLPRTPLAVACGLARWHAASLTVVHVMPALPPRVAEGLPAGLKADVHRWRRSEAREALSRLVADEAVPDGRVVIRAGDIAQGLLDCARDSGAELIVMGGPSAALVRTMIDRAPCPVLAV